MEDFTENTEETAEVHELVGVPDGHVVVSPHGNEEKVVYEYDDDGNFAGWHKEHLGEVE